MMLPLKTKTRQFGVITILSKKENWFNEKDMELFNFIANNISNEYETIIEKNKNLLTSKYFDAVFENEFPQIILEKNTNIVKANKNTKNIFAYRIRYFI